jgi:hypothetical protein
MEFYTHVSDEELQDAVDCLNPAPQVKDSDLITSLTRLLDYKGTRSKLKKLLADKEKGRGKYLKKAMDIGRKVV